MSLKFGSKKDFDENFLNPGLNFGIRKFGLHKWFFKIRRNFIIK